MRIPSASTDRYCYFVAVDVTDLKTRETGLSGFTVYRSRDGGAATLWTTPTVTELSSANMPGVYGLLIDEDTTIGSAHDEEEMVLHITHASMHPVTRVVELFRPKGTEGRTLSLETDGMGHADLKEWLAVAPLALSSQRVQALMGAITAGVIDAAAIGTGAIDADAIAAGAITSGKFAAGAIDAAAIGTGAIDADAIATDAIDGDAIAATAVSEIQSGLALASALATVQADTDDIQTRLPAALVGGRIDASVGAMAAGVVDAAAIGTGAIDADAIAAGAITSSEAPALANLDAAVSTRSSHSAADVWTSGTRTLTSFGTLVSDVATAVWGAGARTLTSFGTLITDIWNNGTRTLTSFGTLIADIWNNATRTLTASLDPTAAQIRSEIDSNSTQLAAIKAKTDNLPSGIKKNTALAKFSFLMVDSADHVTPKTGLTGFTAQRSLDGAAFASCANTVSELANGIYLIDLAAGDLNGDVVTLRFIATGGDARLITVITEP